MLTATRDEGGFAMVTAVLISALAMVLALLAINVADRDRPNAERGDQQRRALEAAQAGAEWYQYELNHDIDYWTRCDQNAAVSTGTGSSKVMPVNLPANQTKDQPAGQTTPVVGRRWRTLGPLEFTVDLMPAAGQTTCSTANPAGTMLTNNTMTVRSIGRYRGQTRTVMTTYRRPGFLDFLYFTNYEEGDPLLLGAYDADFPAWAQKNCGYWRDGRADPDYTNARTDKTYSNACRYLDIQFATGDSVAGPLHTNDEMLACTSTSGPTFGRVNDRVEVSAPARPAENFYGWRPSGASGCTSASPTFAGGRLTTSAPVLDLPPSSASSLQAVVGTNTFTGQTDISLNGQTATVKSWTSSTAYTTKTLTLPATGSVIYVKSGTCGTTAAISQTYSAPTGCAVASVSGTASVPLTIGSQGDVLVTGNLLSTSALPIGLIADQFVRVYHPVDSDGKNLTTTTRYGTAPSGGIEIDAAVLSLQHSFMVDNYLYGAPLGNLKVVGAIAQEYRGAVGSIDSDGNTHGYIKQYSYNDTLKSQEPPSFIDPIQSTWRVIKQVQQRAAPPGV